MDEIKGLTRLIQILELEILKEFQRICEENHLRYFAISGTCLGAIRHNGFIPWDDDIDVAMPFEDYVKFIEIAKNGLNSPYELFNPKDHRSCGFTFLKIHNSETTFVEKVREPYPDSYFGVFIDIMPIFGLPKDEFKKKKVLIETGILIRKSRISGIPFSDATTWWQRALWLTSWKSKLSNDFACYLNRLMEIGAENSFDEANEILFAWRTKKYDKFNTYRGAERTFDKSYFDGYLDMPFEDITIRVPKEYDLYLTKDFHDYMKLPPEEKRVTVHPTAIIDLHTSYKEYAKKRSQNDK